MDINDISVFKTTKRDKSRPWTTTENKFKQYW